MYAYPCHIFAIFYYYFFFFLVCLGKEIKFAMSCKWIYTKIINNNFLVPIYWNLCEDD